MRRLFVITKDKIAQNKTIGELVKNELAVYGMSKQTYLVEPAGLGGNYEWIQIVEGGDALPSDTIEVSNTKARFVKNPFKLPIKPIVRASVEYSGKSTYDEFVIRISPMNDIEIQFEAETFSVNGHFATGLALYTALAKEINCKSYDYCAEGTAAGLDITAKRFNLFFSVGGEFRADPDSMCNDCPPCTQWTVEYLVQGNAGNGTFDDIYKMDYEFRPHKGSLEHFEERLYPTPTLIDKATYGAIEFDTYILSYSNKNHNGGDMGREVFEMSHELVVAIDRTLTTGDEYVKVIETLVKTKLINSPIA
jgi:hypothetical protein